MRVKLIDTLLVQLSFKESEEKHLSNSLFYQKRKIFRAVLTL